MQGMSRVLLTWEMGSNLGHLSRLLPLALRLRDHGHHVLVAVRDVTLAGPVLAPVGIPFVQAPLPTFLVRVSEHPASYADLLRMQGWGDTVQLGVCLRAWLQLLKSYGPQLVVVDHSPTALLAVRCAGIPATMIATGFELPPALQPLPPFPGFSGATAAGAAAAESQVIEAVNQVMAELYTPRVNALRDLFQVEQRWLTTFPELDHYGARPDERYVGPIGQQQRGEPMDWPAGARRVFAYLRRGTPGLPDIVLALGGFDAAVICWAPGVERRVLEPLRHCRVSTSPIPVELEKLRDEADLCVSYAPAGTVTSTLLKSVPQLLAPVHIEAQMTAHRVECMGAGLTLRGRQDAKSIGGKLHHLLIRPEFKARAHAFARRHEDFDAAGAADEIVDQIEVVIAKNKNTGADVR